MSGYMHADYAQSLSEFGMPLLLPSSGGWVLERQIPGFPDRDAMGCYPLFCCNDWSQLHIDVKNLEDRLVSLSMVTDPFGNYDLDYLSYCFPDTVIPFKKHFVVDLQCPLDEIGGRHHRKHARRARRTVEVQKCEQPEQFVDTWVSLYGRLAERHSIKGIRAFSKSAFAKQLAIPGTVVLQAVYEGMIVGAQIYYVQGDVVQCHLGANEQIGYEVGATYALDRYSFEYFADKARWLDLGGGAGVVNDGTDTLSRYKQGWATDIRTAYFCGKIYDHDKYQEIAEAKGTAATSYFPAYREGEFA